MIVRDNEGTIAECLQSISPWVDEMIVVDTGSTDATPEIAKSLGAKVYFFEWIDDFSAARNESLKYATGKWIFWMDSDDAISAKCGEMLRKLADARHDENVLGFVIQVFCPCEDEYTVVDHVKLIRNRDDIRFEGRIHEQVLMPIRRLGGQVLRTDIHVVHSGSDQSPEAKQKKTERDLRILRKDLDERPGHPFVFFNFAMTFAENGEYANALPWIERCLGASAPHESHVAKTFAYWANCLFQLGRLEESLAACQQGRSHFPDDPELLFREGMVLHELKKLDDAITRYRAILGGKHDVSFRSTDPAIETYKCRFNLGMVYQDSGQSHEAEMQWRRILDERPRYRPARRAIGNLMIQRNQIVAAEVEAELMMEFPDLRLDGMLLLGRVNEKKGEFDLARDHFAKCRSEFPSEVFVLDEYCRFCIEHSEFQTAKSLLEDILKLNPNNPAALHNLGWTCLMCQDFEGAIWHLNESLQVRSGSAPTTELLSTALKERDRAIEVSRCQEGIHNSEVTPRQPLAVEIGASDVEELGLLANVVSLCQSHGLPLTIQCQPHLESLFEGLGANTYSESSNKQSWEDPPDFVALRCVKPWHINKASWNLGRWSFPIESTAELWRKLCNQKSRPSSIWENGCSQRLSSVIAKPIIALCFSNSKSSNTFAPDFQNELAAKLTRSIGGNILILNPPNAARPETFEQLTAIIGQVDLLVTADPTVVALGTIQDTSTIALWGNSQICARLTLPRINQLNVVLEAASKQHNRVWRFPWNLIELPGDQINTDSLVELARQMLEKPRYLTDGCIAPDIQLRNWIGLCIEDGPTIRDRNRSFDYLFQEVSRRFEEPTIVETGTIRTEDDWAGGGFFTYLASAYVSRNGGTIHSVDKNERICSFAREICEPFGSSADIQCADSVSFLESFDRQIDVLYLDSLDTYEPGFAEHALRETIAAFGKLHGRSLIVFDDSPIVSSEFTGKGKLAIPWLIAKGWTIVFHGYQAILACA